MENNTENINVTESFDIENERDSKQLVLDAFLREQVKKNDIKSVIFDIVNKIADVHHRDIDYITVINLITNTSKDFIETIISTTECPEDNEGDWLTIFGIQTETMKIISFNYGNNIGEMILQTNFFPDYFVNVVVMDDERPEFSMTLTEVNKKFLVELIDEKIAEAAEKAKNFVSQ